MSNKNYDLNRNSLQDTRNGGITPCATDGLILTSKVGDPSQSGEKEYGSTLQYILNSNMSGDTPADYGIGRAKTDNRHQPHTETRMKKDTLNMPSGSSLPKKGSKTPGYSSGASNTKRMETKKGLQIHAQRAADLTRNHTVHPGESSMGLTKAQSEAFKYTHQRRGLCPKGDAKGYSAIIDFRDSSDQPSLKKGESEVFGASTMKMNFPTLGTTNPKRISLKNWQQAGPRADASEAYNSGKKDFK